MHRCKIFCIFAAGFKIVYKHMDGFMKYLGVILLVLGVICLIIYKFALQENWLLVSALVLELGGILAYIFINRKLS